MSKYTPNLITGEMSELSEEGAIAPELFEIFNALIPKIIHRRLGRRFHADFDPGKIIFEERTKLAGFFGPVGITSRRGPTGLALADR